MGYQQVIVTAWVNEGERPDNSLPSIPGRPDQGLPPWQGGGNYPDQGLPGTPPGVIWPRPPGGGNYPDQGLPGYGRPDNTLPGGQPYPDIGLPGQPGRPDQGLPPYAEPKAYDVPPEPSAPPTAGTWVVAVYGGVATWVFLPDNEHPPEGGTAPTTPDNTLPGGPPDVPDQGLPPTMPDQGLPA